MVRITRDHARTQAVHWKDRTSATISFGSIKRTLKYLVHVRFKNLIETIRQKKAKLRLQKYHILVREATCIFVQIQGVPKLVYHLLATQSKIIARLTRSTKSAINHLNSKKKAKYLIRKKAKMASRFTHENVPIQAVHWETSFYQNACTTFIVAALKRTVSAVSVNSFSVKSQFTLCDARL